MPMSASDHLTLRARSVYRRLKRMPITRTEEIKRIVNLLRAAETDSYTLGLRGIAITEAERRIDVLTEPSKKKTLH
jgi:hypothetical protein